MGLLSSGGLQLDAVWQSPGERLTSLERLSRLLDLVVTWNARVDLTAARDERELVDLYLADALVLAARHPPRLEPSEPETWTDVGSGAGAPGLVLALLRPDLQLTLVEPRAKRIAFLRTAVGSLGLRHPPKLVDRRSSAVLAASSDVAVSRATFAPAEWLGEGARLARKAVWVLLARAEVPALPGWRVAQQVDYCWPLTGVVRHAVAFAPESALG
jgi:16S rRNA (guanine527-N7)-methyltransferase